MAINHQLIEAVDKGDVEKVKAALQAGASCNTLFNENWKWTVLDRAIFTGSLDVINLLLDAGADVNQVDTQNESCLFKAVDLGNLPVIKRIVGQTKNINQVSNDQGLTPVCLALIKRDFTTTKYLIENGANLNPFAPDQSVPYSLVIDNSENDEDISTFIDYFRNANLNLNVKDHKGWTPIMKLVKKGMKATLKHVLGCGADVNLQNNSGGNAVLEAACKEDSEFIELILRAGGNPNLSLPTGFSPLMVACKSGYVDVSKRLVNAGAEVNQRDKQGLTALMYAATSSVEIVRLLLEKNADPLIKCNNQKLASTYALEFKNQLAHEELMR